MTAIYISYLNRLDIEALKITDDEILGAIETSLAAQGRGETVIEPRMHIEPGVARGHFNVLRGAIGGSIDSAGVKVVGDFVDNYKLGYPSEFGVLVLFNPHNGMPKAFIEAGGITDMRTGAVTAIGAKYLARKGSRVLGHIGARGTAYWNVRLLDHLFDFDEIRVHSRRKESRDAFGEKLRADLQKKIVVTDDWQSCIEDADIMDKLVVDDWGQCKGGKFGSLRAHVETGRLSEQTLHAELGQIVAGLKPGRESDDETNLLWHRGLSLSDIALGHAMLTKAERLGLGQRLRFF